LSDDELNRLQVGGASRLKRFFLTLVREGLDGARGILPDAPVSPEVSDEESAGVGFAAGFAPVEEFDDGLTELEGPTSRPSRFLTSFRSQVLVLAIAAVLWLLGSRNLVAMHLPLVGRLAPLDSWWSTWRHFFASWSPNGVGTGDPGMPGYGLLGFAGTLVFGRMGILPRLVLVGASPFAAVGMSRLLKGRVSNRARVVGVLATLGLPTGLNMISQGRIDVLIVVAGLPFITRRLFALMGVAGVRDAPYPEPVPFGTAGWRVTEAGQRLSVIMMIATMTAFAPATLVLVALIIAGVTISRWIARDDEHVGVAPWRLLGSIVFNVAIFLLPMTFDTLVAGRRAMGLFGLARGPWSLPTWTALLRGVDGLFGGGWLGWGLPVAAAVAVLIARRERAAVAAKVGVIAVLTLLVASVTAHHWLGSFVPDLDVLLALYALCLALLAAIGVAAIENDLRDMAFGWRQSAAALAVAAIVAATVPFAVATGSGRFDLSTTSVAESLSALHPSAAGGYRVLWLGDPSVLPLPGWGVTSGLAAATSTNGLPGGNELFTSPSSGSTDVVLTALRQAIKGRTVALGTLLAPAGISAIVVLSDAAVHVDGQRPAASRALPEGLLSALNAQTGLALTLQTPSAAVYTNTDFHGLYSVVTTSKKVVPLFSSRRAAGLLPKDASRVVLGLAPASAFALDVNGHPATRSTSYGWAPTYLVHPSTAQKTATISLHQFPLNGMLALFTLGLWLVIWLGFGWIQRLEWLFTGRRPRQWVETV
jgi:hypothetical protein